MKAHLVKLFYVEAAHRNPAGGPPQQRLHGHSYKIEILASGAPNDAYGWVMDYGDIKALFEKRIARLDHALLNNVPGLEDDTTLPALHRWLETGLDGRPPCIDGVRVSIAGDLCFRPERLAADAFSHMPERIRFTFEAAQSLPQLPTAHPCHHVHGHSYRIEAGATDLDALESVLAELYATVDHRFLNEIEGLEQATCERICEWIWRWLESRGAAPTVVVVQETGTARAIYFGED